MPLHASGTRIMLSALSQATSAKARNAVTAARNAGPDRSWSRPVAVIKRVRLINKRIVTFTRT
jgi:hypothetical protein